MIYVGSVMGGKINGHFGGGSHNDDEGICGEVHSEGDIGLV